MHVSINLLLNTITQKGQKYQKYQIVLMKLQTCLKRVKSSALLNSKAKKYTHDLTQMRPKRLLKLLNGSIMKSVKAFFKNHLSYSNA